MQLYFRVFGLSYDAYIKHHICPLVKYYFPHIMEYLAKRYGMC